VSPAVSVIIPNRDCPLVGRTVRALAAQTRRPDEVLVVGSDWPGALGDRSLVRFLEVSQPLGAGEARNRGVAAATGDLLLFTDADCVPRSDWVEMLVSALTESAVAGGAASFDLEANRWAVSDNIASFHELLCDRPAEPDTAQPLGTLNLGVRREAWERVGPFDAELQTSEDFDWFLRARAAGVRTAFEPQAVVEHAAVRSSRRDVEEHATWYGSHFPHFRRRHPGVFDRGPTWRNRFLFLAAAPLKAWLGARRIFRDHPMLAPARETAFGGIVVFYRAWYRAVAAAWNDS